MADEDENKNNMSGADDELELEAADPEALTEKLAAAEKQRDDYLSGWQRAKADFANYKKEDMSRLEEMAQYGNKDLIRDLISVLHSFDLAIGSSGGVDKGILLIRAQIEDILKRRGLEKIALEPGDEFDPATAEAMLEVASDKPAGKIVEIMEDGYRLHDKVLRAAKVSVSKGGQEK
jgi:molecular chaperone GrpE